MPEFICSDCDKKYKTQSGLYKHRKKIHSTGESRESAGKGQAQGQAQGNAQGWFFGQKPPVAKDGHPQVITGPDGKPRFRFRFNIGVFIVKWGYRLTNKVLKLKEDELEYLRLDKEDEQDLTQAFEMVGWGSVVNPYAVIVCLVVIPVITTVVMCLLKGKIKWGKKKKGDRAKDGNKDEFEVQEVREAKK